MCVFVSLKISCTTGTRYKRSVPREHMTTDSISSVLSFSVCSLHPLLMVIVLLVCGQWRAGFSLIATPLVGVSVYSLVLSTATILVSSSLVIRTTQLRATVTYTPHCKFVTTRLLYASYRGNFGSRKNHFKMYFPSQHLTWLWFLHLSFSLALLKFSGKEKAVIILDHFPTPYRFTLFSKSSTGHTFFLRRLLNAE